MLTYRGKYNSANVMIDILDEETVKQIYSFLNHPAFAHSYLVIMPDCHAGAGVVIGFTMKMNEYVIPHVVGVDIGCFTGNTKVALTDGRELTFLELIEEDKQGKVNFCYSLDQNNRRVISKINNPHQTRIVNNLIKITLDNEEEILCTEDHIFYDREGKEFEARDLTKGQYLASLKDDRIVAEINKIVVQDTPVYCLTIDNHHNFALASGVFVHNCGMLAINLGQIDTISHLALLQHLDSFIKKRIPSGFAHRREPPISKYDDEIVKIIQLANKTGQEASDVLCQLGTLGGGNHFIEVNLDPDNNHWLVIHTGSRNFGLQIANYYQDKAKELMKKMFLDNPANKGADVYKGLEFLPIGHGAEEYIEAMKIAQGFASKNRQLIAKMILENVFQLDINKVEKIESVHNYINFEDKIIRKGAISAQQGQRVVIPLNMRDGTIIATGKGNAKWNYSAPHGAGRVLSRRKAKETLKIEEYQKEMTGVYTSCVTKDTIDESPMAYKDKDLIIDAVGETVDIEFVMKPVYNFKAGGD